MSDRTKFNLWSNCLDLCLIVERFNCYKRSGFLCPESISARGDECISSKEGWRIQRIERLRERHNFDNGARLWLRLRVPGFWVIFLEKFALDGSVVNLDCRFKAKELSLGSPELATPVLVPFLPVGYFLIEIGLGGGEVLFSALKQLFVGLLEVVHVPESSGLGSHVFLLHGFASFVEISPRSGHHLLHFCQLALLTSDQ